VALDALEDDALQYWEDLLDGTDLLGIAARVAAPTLYVNVSHDQVVPPSAAQALVDRMAHATLITVPGRSPIDVWRDRMGVQHIIRFIAQHFGVEADVLRAQRRERKSRVVHPTGLSDPDVEVLRLLAARQGTQPND